MGLTYPPWGGSSVNVLWMDTREKPSTTSPGDSIRMSLKSIIDLAHSR